MDSESFKIKKPKYQEHEDVQGVLKRVTNRRRMLSSYSDYVVDENHLLEISEGNQKLVKDVQEFISEHQKEDAAIGGFRAAGVYRVSKNDVNGGKSDWIHVVFDHGHGVTLISGRIGHPDWASKNFMDVSLLYSMAHMLR